MSETRFRIAWNRGRGAGKCVAILALLGAVACAPVEPVSEGGGPADRLGDTQWVLIGTSSDGSADQLSEVAPYAVTLAFGSTGDARFKLDCNSGSASWKAAPAGATGHLSFGAIAATRALCGPDSIGEKVASDMAYVTRYAIYDGRLTMYLGEGRPAYVWEGID